MLWFTILIDKYSFILGLTFWVLGIIIHLCFLLTFLFFRIREFKLHHMIPSWFVPPVGIIVSAVTF
ncbi:MAG: C4-dicarboxylate ABC transporter, partial [Alphaproteobacteria bacterium]|nr:C4-dicarboxylate ABC transporter [Alphaproteobacteria bacterium]